MQVGYLAQGPENDKQFTFLVVLSCCQVFLALQVPNKW